MQDSEDDPRLKELLRQVEAVNVPEYPAWRRGAIWGFVAGFAVVLCGMIFILVSGGFDDFSKSFSRYGWAMLGVALAVFLIAGSFGAFRPPRDDE